MISYGWTWTGVYSYHVSMAWWVPVVLIAVMATATFTYCVYGWKR
jgi:hypothetical protein